MTVGLLKKVRDILEQNPHAEIHSELAIRIGLEVWKVKRDGSIELLYVASAPDVEKLSFHYPDL